MRPVLLAAALWSVAAAAAENAQLAKALKAYDELKFAEAARALDAAARVPDNDRATVLKIYELQGIVQATLKNSARAEEAFRLLFSLDPLFKFEKELAPRVMTPFYQARSWVDDRSPITLTSLPPRIEKNLITQLGVRVDDPVKLGRKVVFHIRQPSLAWSVQRAEVSGNRYTVSTNAAELEWWAELLGDRGAQLMLVGSAAEPKVEHAIAPTPAAAAAVDTGPPVVSARPSSSKAWLRPAAYAIAGAGAVSGIVGIVFGLRAQSARSELSQATYDGEGRVLTPAQPRALALEQQLKSNALIADVLFAAAGALIATGVVLWLLGLSG